MITNSCYNHKPMDEFMKIAVEANQKKKKMKRFILCLVLSLWDESSERSGMEELRFNHYREQDACFQTIWQEYADDVKLLKEYYLMNGFCGVFVRHYMNTKDEDRIRIQTEFLARQQKVIPACGCPNIVHSQTSGKVWEWGIGALTTTHRIGGMLARTLESYRGSGFAPHVVFTDGNRRGGLWNLH